MDTKIPKSNMDQEVCQARATYQEQGEGDDLKTGPPSVRHSGVASITTAAWRHVMSWSHGGRQRPGG